MTVFDDDDDGWYDPPELKTLLELRYVRHYADSAIPDSLTSTQLLCLQSNKSLAVLAWKFSANSPKISDYSLNV